MDPFNGMHGFNFYPERYIIKSGLPGISFIYEGCCANDVSLYLKLVN